VIVGADDGEQRRDIFSDVGERADLFGNVHPVGDGLGEPLLGGGIAAEGLDEIGRAVAVDDAAQLESLGAVGPSFDSGVAKPTMRARWPPALAPVTTMRVGST